MKYKVGDYVRITAFSDELDEKYLNIGDILKIQKVNFGDYSILSTKRGKRWWTDDNCCEKVYGYQSPLWKVLNGEEI